MEVAELKAAQSMLLSPVQFPRFWEEALGGIGLRVRVRVNSTGDQDGKSCFKQVSSTVAAGEG